MPASLDEIYMGDAQLVMANADGSFSLSMPSQPVVALPGSFNPLHRGHKSLLEAAARITGRKGIFEISIENVDKPDLPRDELESRLKQFSGQEDVAVTRAALFADKAAALPGAWFVLGFDTAVRLLDDRYYPDSDDPAGPATAALLKLGERGVKFVVAGREDKSGEFRKASDLETPDSLREMFVFIPADQFREDISSTQLRRKRDSQSS